MKRVCAWIARPENRRRAVFCVFGVMLLLELVMHLNCDTLFGDDGTFYTVLDSGRSPFDFLASRWQRWSGRLLIEGVLVFTTHSIWVWRVLDSLVMTGIACAIFLLADGERRPSTAALSCLMVLSIPFEIIRSTGWQATSVNYTWPLACALLSLVPSVERSIHRLPGGRTRRLWAGLALLAAVFGTNHEQTAVLLFLMAGAVAMRTLLQDGRPDGHALAVLAIASAEIALHLLCPGNALRSASSTAANLRDYGQYTLLGKLSVGFTSTATLLFYTRNYPFWGCLAMLLCVSIAKRRPLPYLLPALAAPLLCLAASRWAQLPALPWLARYSAYDVQLGPAKILLPGQTFGMGAFVFCMAMVALSMGIAAGAGERAQAAVFAYAAGFAARLVLSFSPTVVESGERTMLPLYACLMLSALLCTVSARRAGRCGVLLAGGGIVGAMAAASFFGSFSLAM